MGIWLMSFMDILFLIGLLILMPTWKCNSNNSILAVWEKRHPLWVVNFLFFSFLFSFSFPFKCWLGFTLYFFVCLFLFPFFNFYFFVLYISLLLIWVIFLVYLNAIDFGCTFSNLSGDIFIFLWIHWNYGFSSL